MLLHVTAVVCVGPTSIRVWFDDDTVKSGGSQPEFGEQTQLLGFTAGLGVNGWHGTLPPPRVIGVRANFRFGG